MILKGISVNQDPPTKDYLWITPKGNTRFWNQSTWMLIGGNGGGGGADIPTIEAAGKYLVTTGTEGNYSMAWSDINLSSYINGTSGYAAVFNGNNSIISAIGNNSKIRIGNGIIEWDSTNNGFKIYNATSTQETPTTAGIYADWVSALGVNSSGGGGGGGMDEVALWQELTDDPQWTLGDDKIINVSHLPNNINADTVDGYHANSFAFANGTNATGTWGISISGNAATATTASKLGTSNVGNSTNPIYLSSGTATACTYSLSSTVNAGTANYLAYYSGANAISSTSNLVVSGNTINLPQINNVALNFRPNHDNYSGWIAYETAGNEAMVFGLKNTNTSFIFANTTSEANVSNAQWQSLTPALQIKQNCVYINSLITNGTTPSYNLYVNGTSYLNGVTEIPNLLYINDYIRLGQGGNVIDGYRKSTSAFAGLHLNYYSNGNTTLCYGGGNVGIGTNSPAYKLDVKGDAYNIIRLFRNHATNGSGIRFENNSGCLGYFGYDGNGYYAWTDSSGNNKMIFKPDGTLGVNTTSPSSQCKLHVNGNIYATGGVTALQAVSSDKRLKKNIKKFNAKDIIDKLNPVSFEWNSKAKKLSDFKDGTNYGLIAQDSDGIIDNLVFDLPDGKGYKGVRYEKLIPILLQAVKEQQSEINELKQIIKKLKV